MYIADRFSKKKLSFGLTRIITSFFDLFDTIGYFVLQLWSIQNTVKSQAHIGVHEQK